MADREPLSSSSMIPMTTRGFEQAVIADYGAKTAVERELVLRLASPLWRLRRATAIETALLQIQNETPRQSTPYRATRHNLVSNGRRLMTLATTLV